MTKHRKLQQWVDEMAQMCQPDNIVWIDGSEEQQDLLAREAFSTGELIQLDQEKLPGCVYHRTAVNDVARTENLTFICTTRREDAGPTNNWMSPEDGYARAGEIFAGSMRGRTMYVIPFSMGPVGSPLSKIGVELTDSIYVVRNMVIVTRVGPKVLECLGADGEFTKCLHGKAERDINKRLILHFPEDNAIWSVGSGYGGNVLLGKKCLALRIASYLGRQEGWMAEHMLILGIESPDGKIEYVAAAFPSACGKTNLAMLVPPEGLKVKGYKIWTVGDDISWMQIDNQGQLRAINPEWGFFGVAPGTNYKSNPNMMETIKTNTIYTNVMLAKDGTVWWEDGEGPPPAEGWDWQGRPWKPGMKDENGKPIPGANPNSRFTSPITQCPTCSALVDDASGVPISALIFGGRRAKLAPLVFESFNWRHGVFVGATMASERTAAQYGKQGEVRRDPMAMLPFCGYHMGDYFQHWLEMGDRMSHPPKIFHVNWFRTDEKGKFLWPGFGENLRVLEWIIDRCRGEAEAVETPIGYVPTPASLDLTGLQLPAENLEKLCAVDRGEWLDEADRIEEFFQQFGDRFPVELREELGGLRRRLETPLRLLPPGDRLRPLAAELNKTIERENPHVFEMLSELGKRLYFPKGIVSQGAEAREKAKHYNATIGIAREKGQPMSLPSVMQYFNGLEQNDLLPYAPAAGRADLRKLWRDDLLRKNPSLAGKSFSNPIVTSGLTHALSIVGDLLVERGDVVLIPDKFWENYELIFGVRRQAQLALYPLFNEGGGFNVAGLRSALAARPKASKTAVILNFPNNPTGYSPSKEEMDEIVAALVETAEAGKNLVVIADDAYFGLFYGKELARESVFAHLADRHPRLLAVKADAATKEDFVWGFRTGMITFSTKAADDASLYQALEQKTTGAIRSILSNCSHPSQTILAKALGGTTTDAERQENNVILESRAKKVQKIIAASKFAEYWEPYPFNAGYFMCVRLKGIDAETYRKHLLDRHGVGVIANGDHDIRVAFSGVDEDRLEDLFDVLAAAAGELLGKK